ncbi:MAG: hypothetical protein ACPGD5_11190 [Salibacteraceae bacterium]
MTYTYLDVLALYDSLVEQCEGFERKGKTMPYTSANGYMFSLLNKSGELGFRFSEKRKMELIEKWGSQEFKSYNAVMKGYVLIPSEKYDSPKELIPYLTESFNYVMTLPPK